MLSFSRKHKISHIYWIHVENENDQTKRGRGTFLLSLNMKFHIFIEFIWRTKIMMAKKRWGGGVLCVIPFVFEDYTSQLTIKFEAYLVWLYIL